MTYSLLFLQGLIQWLMWNVHSRNWWPDCFLLSYTLASRHHCAARQEHMVCKQCPAKQHCDFTVILSPCFSSLPWRLALVKLDFELIRPETLKLQALLYLQIRCPREESQSWRNSSGRKDKCRRPWPTWRTARLLLLGNRLAYEIHATHRSTVKTSSATEWFGFEVKWKGKNFN